jgi:hypothetical protein
LAGLLLKVIDPVEQIKDAHQKHQNAHGHQSRYKSIHKDPLQISESSHQGIPEAA